MNKQFVQRVVNETVTSELNRRIEILEDKVRADIEARFAALLQGKDNLGNPLPEFPLEIRIAAKCISQDIAPKKEYQSYQRPARITANLAAIIDAIPCDMPEGEKFNSADRDPHTTSGIRDTIERAGRVVKEGTVSSTLYSLRAWGVIHSRPVEIVTKWDAIGSRGPQIRTKAGFVYWQDSPEVTRDLYIKMGASIGRIHPDTAMLRHSMQKEMVSGWVE